MKLLAIETSAESCSVALCWGDTLHVQHEVVPRKHAELVLPAVEALLARADGALSRLDAIAFGRGPGSFTGVRIAASVAQGLALGADLPVLPISTLAVQARGAFRRQGWRRVLVAQDARMSEVYSGMYLVNVEDDVRLIGREVVVPPSKLQADEQGQWCGCGSAWSVYGDAMRKALGSRLVEVEERDEPPHAADLVALAGPAFKRGEGVDAGDAVPVYVRDRVTRPSAVP